VAEIGRAAIVTAAGRRPVLVAASADASGLRP